MDLSMHLLRPSRRPSVFVATGVLAVCVCVALAVLGVWEWSTATILSVIVIVSLAQSVILLSIMADSRRLLKRQAEDFAEIEALVDLRSLVQPQLAMPASRGWAASPTTLLSLVTCVLESEPPVVVECGSGGSSVWIGYALRRIGKGRCVALEHDPKHASVTRAEIARHGLEDVVEVRTAPLTEVDCDGGVCTWYEPSQIADLDDVGVVFVDGPPGTTCAQARYPAAPMLAPRCRPGALFVVDDADRPDESQMVARWASEQQMTKVRRSSREKGWELLALSGD